MPERRPRSASVADVTDYAAIQSAAKHIDSVAGPASACRLCRRLRLRQIWLSVLEPGAQRLGPRLSRESARRRSRGARFRSGACRGKSAGTMLFLSSVAGQIGSQTDPPYSAAKAGLINFAMCRRQGFRPVRRPRQYALPRDGANAAQSRRLAVVERQTARRKAARPTTSGAARRSSRCVRWGNGKRPNRSPPWRSISPPIARRRSPAKR